MNRHDATALPSLLSTALIGLLAVMPVAAQASLQARDLDGQAGTIEAYYDTDQGITWLAGGRYASPEGASIAMGELRTGYGLEAFVGALDVHGTTGWRLPNLLNTACATSGAAAGCTGPQATELSHLWQVTLGNSGAPGSIASMNAGPFQAVFDAARNNPGFGDLGNFWLGGWTGLQTGDGPYPVGFTLRPVQGLESGNIIQRGDYISTRVWLVHDGDVAAVPEPGSSALLLVGLFGLGGVARYNSPCRRQKEGGSPPRPHGIDPGNLAP